jgi:hypothetical protein
MNQGCTKHLSQLSEKAVKLEKKLKGIERKAECDIALLHEDGGFELSKAKAGLEGNRKALALAEKRLEDLNEEETAVENLLEQTAGCKRDTTIASEQATLEGAKQTFEMMVAKAEAIITQARQTYEKAQLKYERVKKEADSLYETKSVKAYQKLTVKRAELETRVAGYKIAVETSEDRVAKLSSKAKKVLIKSEFTAEPVKEELEEVVKERERINKSQKDSLLQQIRSYYPAFEYMGESVMDLESELDTCKLRAQARKDVSYKSVVLTSPSYGFGAVKLSDPAPASAPASLAIDICPKCKEEMNYCEGEYFCCNSSCSPSASSGEDSG